MAGIISLSEAVSLALHGMALIATKSPNVVSAKRIAEETGASQAHLAKVMQRLVKAGLVTSVTGPKGGFQLGRAPENISFLDIYEAIEGPLSPAACLIHKGSCPFHTCLLDGFTGRVTDEFRKHFGAKKLSDVIARGV